jgi:hypothetical protein
MVDWYAGPRDPTTIQNDWVVFDPRPEAMPIQDHIEYLRDALNQHRGPGAAELVLRGGRGHPNGVEPTARLPAG